MRNGPINDPRLLAAFEAADVAQQILIEHYGKLNHVSEKYKAGLVSEADVESEKAIAKVLKKHFPESRFLGEESGLDQKPVGDELLWIVDPLDGTTNYVHQMPIFCISIGLKVGSSLEVGVIDVPMLKQRFYALKNKGAFLNGDKIHISERKELKNTLLATGFSNNHGDVNQQVAIFSDLILKTRGIRRAGAAAYDLCLVAQGVFDGFWEKHLSSWDTAAGTLLVREAGGVVSNFAGDFYDVEMSDIIAGSKFTHPFILNTITSKVLPI
ncbi:MAG: inositol monophosphatase family protein [Pseudomonadota bacterium]|nr:inositol monophosphatase family protein [Pseudomonadota bacterium]